MELALVGAVFALLAVAGYFAVVHFVRARQQKRLKPLLGVAETRETLRAAAQESDMENA